MNSFENLLAKPDDAVETVGGDCPEHGPFENEAIYIGGRLLNGDPVCPECQELCEESKEFNNQRQQERERKQRLERRVRSSGIPLRIIDAGKYEPTTEASKAALKTVMAYRKNFQAHYDNGGSLILCGKPGTGKTHLACKLGISLIRECGGTVAYSTANSLLREIRSTYAKDSERSESSVINHYADCDLLILDELGVKAGTDHERSTLFEIIDLRYQNKLPTVVISNLMISELTEATDARMIDRLKQNGTLVVFDWESYRGAA